MEIIKTIKQIPVSRFLLPLIFGIILGNYINPNSLPLLLSFLFFFIASTVLGFVPYFKNKINYQKYYGIAVSGFVLLMGIIIADLERETVKTVDELSQVEAIYIVKVKNLPQEKNKTYRIDVELVTKIDSFISPSMNKGAILYVSKEDSSVRGLIPGDKLLLKTKLQEIKNKGNPNEFDYRKFINRRGFYYTAYLNAGDYVVWENGAENGINRGIAELRLSILNRLRAEFDDQRFALLSSMLIGVKDDLDDETRASFSASGITHLLAISGLHVGILYLVLNYLLSFLGNTLSTRITRNISIVFVLWLYALLAGMSPSVTRATIMFTVIVISKLLNRDSSIYNNLAFAALIMLVLNPNNLFEVGFQLSFLAVLGIVYFQPRINGLVKTENKVLSFVWSLVSVSIAAQLATFPMTIFYFHQFPNYFIIGNLLAIPLFFLNLVLGLAYVVFGWIPLIGPGLQYVIDILSWAILKSSEFVSQLRFAVTDGLYFTGVQVMVIYLTLISIAYFLTFRRGKFFISAQVSLLVFILINFYLLNKNSNNKELTIYNNKNTIITCVAGFDAHCFVDSANADYEYAVKRHLVKKQAIKKLHLAETDAYHEVSGLILKELQGNNSLLVFVDKKFLFLSDAEYISNEKIKVDYVVLTNNCNASIRELSSKLDFDKIIFAASNSSWNISSWISDCNLLGADYYSIPDSGAFQVSFSGV